MIFAERFIEMLGPGTGLLLFLGTALVELIVLVVFLIREPSPFDLPIRAVVKKSRKRKNSFRLIYRAPAVLGMEIS